MRLTKYNKPQIIKLNSWEALTPTYFDTRVPCSGSLLLKLPQDGTLVPKHEGLNTYHKMYFITYYNEPSIV